MNDGNAWRESLDPAVRRVIEAERERALEPADAALLDAARIRLDDVLRVPAATASVAAPTVLRSHALAATTASFFVGALLSWWVMRDGVAPPPPPPPPPPTVTPSTVSAPPMATLPKDPPLVVVPAPSDSSDAPLAARSAAPDRAPIAPAPRGTGGTAKDALDAGVPRATTEDALIDTAREALARGLVDQALRALDEHAARHANGALTEEREALAVRALVAAGRKNEAAERAGAFRRRWPDSVFLGVVDQSLR